MIGSEGSAMGFLTAQNLQIPGVDRLFIDPTIDYRPVRRSRHIRATIQVDANLAKRFCSSAWRLS